MDKPNTGAQIEQQQEQPRIELQEPRFFIAGGTLAADAASYLSRAADDELFRTLLEGQYAYMLDSRQKGKSSLVSRTQVRLEAAGVKTIKIDLQSIGSNLTVDQWYASLVRQFGRQLGLEREAFECWGENYQIGPFGRWLSVIEQVVLPNTSTPIVVFIDEVDFVRSLPFSADEFFAGIRECYNRRAKDESFTRLTFCLIGSATPSQLVSNVAITPFNIGREVKLTDFSRSDLSLYAPVLRGSRNGEALLDRVYFWTRGHPYLTQALCAQIAENPQITDGFQVDRLVERTYLSTEARQREPNLLDVSRRLLETQVGNVSAEESRGQMLNAYSQVLKGKKLLVDDSEWRLAALRLCGAVSDEAGTLAVRNEIYRRAFDRNWIRANMPDAELRRQRSAARGAMLRTAAVAGVLLLAISSAAVGIFRISKDREKALVALGQRTSDLSRVSSDRKAALASLGQLNENLKRTSSERETALSSLKKSNESLKVTSSEREKAVFSLEKQSDQLKHRNEELNRVSKQREHALIALGSRTSELKAKNYVGLMSSIQLAMKEDRYTRIAELVKQSKDNPLRGWEWGHASMLVNSHEAEVLLPENAVFERQPDNSRCVITADSIYDFTPKGLKFRRKLATPNLTPYSRYGDLRMGRDPITLASVFRDADTDLIKFSHSNQVRGLNIDPEHRMMLVQVNPSDGGPRIELRSMAGNKPPITFEAVTTGPAIAAFLNDGTILAVHYRGEVIRWDRSGRKLSTQQIPYFVTRGPNTKMALNRDSSLFCFYDDQYRQLEVRRTSDLSVVATMSGTPLQASSCGFSPDSSQLIVGGYDGSVRVFSANNGDLMKVFVGHVSKVLTAFFWDDHNRIVSMDAERHCRIWSLDSPSAVDVYREHKDQVLDAALINHGNTLISQTHYGLPDRAIVCRDLRTGKTSSRRGDYEDMTFNDSNIFLALANGNVERLSVDGLKLEKTAQIFKQWMLFTGVFDHGTRLLVADGYNQGEVVSREHAIVDTESMTVRSRFTLDWPKGSNMFPNYSFDREEKTLLVAAKIHGKQPGTYRGLAFLISCADGKILKKIELDTPFDASHLTPDGKQMILGQIEDGSQLIKPIIFDVASLKVVGSLPPVKSILKRFEFDQLCKALVGLSRDGPAYLWDFDRRCLVATLSPGTGIEGFSFSPDGSRVVTSGPNRTNVVWDTRTGEELLTLRYKPLRENDQLGGLHGDMPAFSDDGRKIIVGCTDGAVRIFNSLPWKDQPKSTPVKQAARGR